MTTHLIHALINMRDFNRWAGERGLVQRGAFDEGYALHILLSAMFGKAVLQPFRLFASERRRSAALYAYADIDAKVLQQTAAAVGATRLHRSDRSTTDSIETDALSLRARAASRLRYPAPARASTGPDPNGPAERTPATEGSGSGRIPTGGHATIPQGWADPAAAASKNGVTRESVYTDWLIERLGAAASVEQCNLAAFRRNHAIRGAERTLEGPDTTLHGTLAVSDPTVFAQILRNGIGRHRAYGYGMLLLRPPTPARPSSSC